MQTAEVNALLLSRRMHAASRSERHRVKTPMQRGYRWLLGSVFDVDPATTPRVPYFRLAARQSLSHENPLTTEQLNRRASDLTGVLGQLLMIYRIWWVIDRCSLRFTVGSDGTKWLILDRL